MPRIDSASPLSARLQQRKRVLLETMTAAAVVNLVANVVCSRLLSPYRNADVNMASAWECSRNDVIEGIAIIATARAVWLLSSGWPDIIVAAVLLAVFLRSALRVLINARRALALVQVS